MKYYSSMHQSEKVSFRQATLQGQAPDKGLYFPEVIPVLPQSFFKTLPRKSKAEIAFEVIKPYVSGDIPEDQLYRICSETVDFDFPLVQINEFAYSLELYHGPTMAFKDVGARFMSRCLEYFSRGSSKHLTILVATSGDTGSAVANGFLGIRNIDVVILYPSGKVSPVQEKQLTTLGRNITALEVKGSFDDCQAMVKKAFLSQVLNKKLSLSSANSINIARWLPQQFYYFFAIQQWPEENLPVITVPSGNFGNLCAGLLANRSGLEVAHFIAACNANDVFTRFLDQGVYQPSQAVATYSNAMDVGDPSNFVRLSELFGHDIGKIRSILSSYSIDDDLTISTIREVFAAYQYLMEPHGAVGYASLSRYLESKPGCKGIVLETAHPVKFVDVVESAVGQRMEIPAEAMHLMELTKKSIVIEPVYEDLEAFLLKR